MSDDYGDWGPHTPPLEVVREAWAEYEEAVAPARAAFDAAVAAARARESDEIDLINAGGRPERYQHGYWQNRQPGREYMRRNAKIRCRNTISRAQTAMIAARKAAWDAYVHDRWLMSWDRYPEGEVKPPVDPREFTVRVDAWYRSGRDRAWRRATRGEWLDGATIVACVHPDHGKPHKGYQLRIYDAKHADPIALTVEGAGGETRTFTLEPQKFGDGADGHFVALTAEDLDALWPGERQA